MVSQEIFSVNSKIIKKAVTSIRKIDKNLPVHFYGKGSEIYLHIHGSPHCMYAHYKIEDAKINSDFSFSVSSEELNSSIVGATGEVSFNKHSEHTIEVDVNTKKSYLIFSDTNLVPMLKIKDEIKYNFSGDRLQEFAKAFNSNLINSWAIIDDFYYLHIENEAERLLSPNIIFYKSRTKEDLQLSVPGFIIKNFPTKSDIDIVLEDKACFLISDNFTVLVDNKYCSPSYKHELSKSPEVTINTAKLLGVVSAMDKECVDDKIDILYLKDDAVVFQCETSKCRFDIPKGLIAENTRVTTSCSNLKKAMQFLLNNETIKMKLYFDNGVIKGIEFVCKDKDNLEYVVLSAKR